MSLGANPSRVGPWANFRNSRPIAETIGYSNKTGPYSGAFDLSAKTSFPGSKPGEVRKANSRPAPDPPGFTNEESEPTVSKFRLEIGASKFRTSANSSFPSTVQPAKFRGP